MTLDLRHDTEGRRAQLLADVRAGLADRPRTLPSKYFYDARGSELFEQITRLQEYYPTRTERSILLENADSIGAATDAETLVELGSGTSEKTRILIEALRRHGTLRRFVPLDVDPAVLGEAAELLRRSFRGLEVEPMLGDFEHPLPHFGGQGPVLIAFLGSTIGNLQPEARHRFLSGIADALGAADHLLLGTDLVKDPARLVRAYDDSAGVTASFNRNILAVINAELGTQLEPERFDHIARWNPEHEWIEMWLRATSAQQVNVPASGWTLRLEEGEEIRTEISTKFRRQKLVREFHEANLTMTAWLTDPAEDFALSLIRRAYL